MTLTRRRLAHLGALGAGELCSKASAQSAPASSFPKADGLTLEVARFARETAWRDIPVDVIDLGKKSILDGLGLALCGSMAESGRISRAYVKSQGISAGDATIIGSSLKVPARFAAFVNGIGIHADDYDDTQLAVAEDRVYGLLTHPTAPVLSAALATGEARGISGRDLMTAYHVGVEVECKIAEAISPRHYEDGFHTTGTVGALGAATAVARVFGLDTPQILRALGIAASEAAGLRENFGTMTKPFHAGRAAESGIVAVDLAGLGWTAAEQILEAPRGFFHAAGGNFDPNAIVHKLGNPWTFRTPGVSIKPYPSGSLTHPAMTELERLIRTEKIDARRIERVDVGTNRNMPNALIHHHPKTGLEAKFSMEFCMASLLLYGKAGLSEFTDEVVNRPEVQNMIGRVRFGVNPVAEAAGYNKMTSILEIRLQDGRTISGRADFAKGSPAIPMSFDEVSAKFLDCAAFAKWPHDKATAVIAAVGKLETMPNVRALTALLVG
ncbi:MAG TPA: MmgE/PrpD family protein [Bryobacteraceae bacterium]|nr:MmgE/PrpD family protein [Bryobacteraceae bacterium]